MSFFFFFFSLFLGSKPTSDVIHHIGSYTPRTQTGLKCDHDMFGGRCTYSDAKQMFQGVYITITV